MKNRISHAVSTIFILIVIGLGQLPDMAFAQQNGRGRMRSVTRNLYAPNLYADKLALKITLVNLPGARVPGSLWGATYQVFFVAERDFENAAKFMGRNVSKLTPDLFPTKILLTEGEFKKKRLTLIQDRTVINKDILFKVRIPDPQRTSFASLLTFYSVKIYDAKLKKTLYKSGAFIGPPFDPDSPATEPLLPRDTLYLNFYVADDGSLYDSKWKRADNSTQWKN